MSAAPGLRGVASLLDSTSLAIVGATDRPGTPGSRVLQYLRENGFRGEVLAVNPRVPDLGGVPCAASLAEVRPGPIDQVLVLTPAQTVPEILAECVRRGVGAVSLFSAGYSEIGGDGQLVEQQFRDIIGDSGLRVLGPNCLGIVNAHTGLIASPASAFMSGAIMPGPVSVISQSGAVGAYLVGLLGEVGLGIRYYASTGNEVDIRIGELLLHCAADEQTKAIVVYVEGLREAASFVDALALARSRGTNVIVLKAGRTEVGAQAVRSHTAALAGDDAVYDAVFARLGAYRADSVLDAVSAVQASLAPRRTERRTRRLAVLTTSGGLGVLATDALIASGFELPPVPAETQRRMRELLPFCAPGNPVDLGGQVAAEPEAFGKFLQLTAESMDIDGVVVVVSNGPRSRVGFAPMRAALCEFAAGTDLAVAAVGALTDVDREDFGALGMIAVNDPADAARRLAVLDKVTALRSSTGEIRRPDKVGVADFPMKALDDITAMQLLAGHGVQFAPHAVIDLAAPTVPEDNLFPAAVKLLQTGVLHKAAAGNVVLDVRDGSHLAEVLAGFRARGHGHGRVLVQAMIDPAGDELIVASRRDPVFGPVYVVGTGGRHVEAMQDRILLPRPLTRAAVAQALGTLRFLDVARWSEECVRTVTEVVLAVQDLMEDDPTVAEVEINPVMVGKQAPWAVAVDAVILRRDDESAQ
ncbi:MAG: CoA-binding protein [Marmoricola sp.]|nr:CoA-binding protein [Marmoricola sp.]